MGNFSNYAFRLHTVDMDSDPAIVFGGVTDLSHILEHELSTPETGGAFRASQAVVRQAPQIPIVSEALADILANIGLTGKCITADGTHAGLAMYSQRHDPCSVGARSASTNHSVTFPSGHLFLESVQGDGVGSNARATMRAHAISGDGATQPWSVAFNVTLPTGAIEKQYAIAKPTILGVTLDKIESINVNYNPNFTTPNDAATIWPSEIDPSDFDFTITITARSPEFISEIPAGFHHTDDDTFVRFVKRATSAAELAAASHGGFADFDTAVHIEGAVHGLVYVPEAYSASGRATGRMQIMIAGVEGATAPIVWDPAIEYALDMESS